MPKKYLISIIVLIAVVAFLSISAYEKQPMITPNVKKISVSAPKAAAKPAEAPKEASKKGAVAARVNGEVITVEEIRQGYEDNPQIAEQMPFNEFYERAVDVFVDGKLLYQEATKADILESPEYKDQLQTAQEDLARRVFLQKVVESKVTPDAVQAFYNAEYVSKFDSKPEMNAKHILVDDEQTAKDVIAKLNQGENFDDVAKKYTKDNTVDLGYFTEEVMVPEFSNAAKALKVGEYTKEPVKTQFGYHVILLTDLRDSAPLPLSELEPQIKNILSQQVIAETFDDLHKKSTVEKYDLDGKKISEPSESK